MTHLFEGNSANEVWAMAADTLLTSPEAILQESRSGATRELRRACIRIENPRDRWVVAREPAMNLAFALAEIVWIMNGRRDSRFLNFWNRQLPKYAGEGAEYHGAYGWRLRNHLGVDQLDRAYLALKNMPDSRQVVLQIWDSVADLPRPDGSPVSMDVPCNLVSMLKVRDGRLEWTQIMRSNDIFRGLPHNIVQFTFLQEVMSGWLGLETGTYFQLSDSLHVYLQPGESSLPRTNERPEKNGDTVALEKSHSEWCWHELSYRVDRLIEHDVKESDVRKLADWKSAPESFRNMILVLCAESARRHRFKGVADDVMSTCTNDAYKQLWGRWVERMRGTKADERGN